MVIDGVLAAAMGAVLMTVWWLFFSRARWPERLGALAGDRGRRPRRPAVPPQVHLDRVDGQHVLRLLRPVGRGSRVRRVGTRQPQTGEAGALG